MDPIATKLLESLKGTRYACSSLSIVSGGNANFTYRGTMLSPLADERDSPETIIIKHAEPYIAVNPEWSLDVTRSKFESIMLTALKSLPSRDSELTRVTTAKLYLYDDKTDTQLITDFRNSMQMKAYLTKYGTRSSGDHVNIIQSPQATRLGKALGQWAHDFHEWGASPAQAKITDVVRGNPMASAKHYYTYGSLLNTIPMFPEILEGCEDMFRELDARDGKELESGAGQLIHGDFWTGNILLHDSPPPPSTEPVKIMVVDWEVATVGPRAYDLGQIFAELYLLTYFRHIDEGTAMIESFMESYGRVDKEVALRAAIHFGMHFLAWTCKVPNWADEGSGSPTDGKIMEGLVKFGRDTMEAAYREDLEHFRGSVLHPLFFLHEARA